MRCALVDLQAVVARPSKSSAAVFAVGVEEIQEQGEPHSGQDREVKLLVLVVSVRLEGRFMVDRRSEGRAEGRVGNGHPSWASMGHVGGSSACTVPYGTM